MKALLPVLILLPAMAALAASGDADTTFVISANQYVRALAVQPDGSVLVGGEFTALGGKTRNYLGRLSSTGVLDTTFDPNFDSITRTIVVLPSGQLLIGGVFFTVGGQPQRFLARLNANGSLDPDFVTPVFPGTIYGICPLDDGRIVIAGQGTPNPPAVPAYLARLYSTGGVDSGFTATAGGIVYSMARQPDGKFVIGGLFTHVDGQPRNHIARLNEDGTLDPTFDPNVNNTVYCVAVQPDGRILLGGAFGTVGGVAQPVFGRVNADGTLDSGFVNAFGSQSGIAFTTILQADGKIQVGGTFTSPNGYYVRLTASGALDSTYHPNSLSEVYGLAGQTDGKELVGGMFGLIGGTNRSFLARLLNDAAPQSLTATSTNRVQWLRGGAAPEAVSVTFDYSTDSGASWVPLGAGARIAGGWELTGLNLAVEGVVRARARTPGGYFSDSSSLLETVRAYAIPLSLSDWKAIHLGDAGASNDGDPDGDGLGNILEYATGGNPLVADGLPVASLTAVTHPSGFQTPTLTFSRSTAAIEATLTVQASTDLVVWTDLARSVGGAAMMAVGNGVTVAETGSAPRFTVRVQSGYLALVPFAPLQYFLRLQATPISVPAAPAFKSQIRRVADLPQR